MAHDPPSLQREIERLCGALNLNDANQSITKDQLANVSQSLELSLEELDIIFSSLDQDNKGRITVQDLRFEVPNDRTRRSTPKKTRISDVTILEYPTYFNKRNIKLEDLDISLLNSQEQVCDLYQKLHASEYPELLTQFENIILGVIKDIRIYQQENERLEKTYKREKEQHEKHLRSLEDEMDAQMQKVEDRVRKMVTEKAEQEKNDKEQFLNAEITMLQDNLKKMQNEGVDRPGRETEEQMNNLKARLEEYQVENRQMRSELTDSLTNLALVRSELVSMKQQYQEKFRECQLEKEHMMECIKEQDNLTRQLHMLHDTNQKLHDTNDALREALDTSNNKLTTHKRTLSQDSAASARSSTSPRSHRKGSVMSDYFDTPARGTFHRANSVNSSLAEEIYVMDSVSVSSGIPVNRRLRQLESCDDENAPEDMDSGHSTMRDYNELDTESECLGMDAEYLSNRRRHKRLKPGYVLQEEHGEYSDQEYDSHDEMETDAENREETEMFKAIQSKKLSSSGSRGSRGSLRSIQTNDHGSTRTTKSARASTRRQQAISPEQMIPVRMSKEPERMYKVVLAGDAAVGKSSFIMRLCKGKFVNNLSSTLGVDFQTKVIEVDGRTVALQLWDTAGQERFRSIAKSYFRRADGVLLLYDCTYERSFLNVRDWVEAVEDGSAKKLPIMFCANKTDIRDEMEQQGRRVVKYDDGLRLAREYEGLFIETSAKDGSNIQDAVTELARLLRTNEDIEVKNVGMQIHDLTLEKKNGSCCRR